MRLGLPWFAVAFARALRRRSKRETPESCDDGVAVVGRLSRDVPVVLLDELYISDAR